MTPPFSKAAEASVVGAMLARPKVIGEVVGAMLQPDHFYLSPLKILFDTLIDRYYSDGATDPLSIVEAAGKSLTDPWGCDTTQAVARAKELADEAQPHEALAHAKIVRRDSDRRSLLELASHVTAEVHEEVNSPEQIAAETATRAMQVATATLLTNDLLTYDELGRRFIIKQRELIAAKRAGIELGVRFGMRFLDDRMHGLKPTELMILGGEPGVGKSGLAWAMARQFANRQLKKPADQRIATFVASLEMSEEPSSSRLAQALALVDGAHLRDGSTTDDELARIIKEWGAEKDAPLVFNFTSMLRASQLRALVVEAIRRYNVGLVIVDHMRYFDADRRFDSSADEDESKARFLKESIAKELGVAVVVLAHTTKGIENTDDRRPRLSHLRGGGMVAAHADFVAFFYSPYAHASEEDVLEGNIARTDAELIWGKNRHGLTQPSYFHFDPSIQLVRDRI